MTMGIISKVQNLYLPQTFTYYSHYPTERFVFLLKRATTTDMTDLAGVYSEGSPAFKLILRSDYYQGQAGSPSTINGTFEEYRMDKTRVTFHILPKNGHLYYIPYALIAGFVLLSLSAIMVFMGNFSVVLTLIALLVGIGMPVYLLFLTWMDILVLKKTFVTEFFLHKALDSA